MLKKNILERFYRVLKMSVKSAYKISNEKYIVMAFYKTL